jgi:hypothetical protein
MLYARLCFGRGACWWATWKLWVVIAMLYARLCIRVTMLIERVDCISLRAAFSAGPSIASRHSRTCSHMDTRLAFQSKLSNKHRKYTCQSRNCHSHHFPQFCKSSRKSVAFAVSCRYIPSPITPKSRVNECQNRRGKMF